MGAKHGCRRRGNRIADGPLKGNGPCHGTRQRPGRRRPRGPSAGEEGKPPVGCVSAGRRQSRSLRQQSHPARFVAGAGNIWRASTHKGSPMFRRRAPARNTLGPRGLLTARAAARRQEAPRDRGRVTPIRGMAADAIRGAMTFSPRRPVMGRRDAHTVAEGDARWGVPPHAGRLPRRQESGRRGRGMRRRQDALGTARRLRGAPRLLAEDSTGSAPLQSG